MKKENKGFTLAELLIVVAIIAVLVAISIPVFTSQLEKSREATDLANVRAKYAEIVALATSEEMPASESGIVRSGSASEYTYTAVVELKQTQRGWTTLPVEVSDVKFEGTETAQWKGTPVKGGVCTIKYSPDTGVQYYWSGLTSAAGSCWNCVDGYVTYNQSGYASGYKANAISQLIDAKAGQKVRYSSLDKNETIKQQLDQGYKYKIGLFYLDPNDNNASGGYKVLYDSGEWALKTEQGYYTNNTGKDVKVAIQVFKYNTDASGNYTGKPIMMTDEEANAFASLFSISG